MKKAPGPSAGRGAPAPAPDRPESRPAAAPLRLGRLDPRRSLPCFGVGLADRGLRLSHVETIQNRERLARPNMIAEADQAA